MYVCVYVEISHLKRRERELDAHEYCPIQGSAFVMENSIYGGWNLQRLIEDNYFQKKCFNYIDHR